MKTAEENAPLPVLLPFSLFPCAWPFQPLWAGLKDTRLTQNLAHSGRKGKRDATV